MKNLDKAETKGGKGSAFAPTGIMAPVPAPKDEKEKPAEDKPEKEG